MAWGNNQIRELVIRTLLGESNRTQEGMVSVAHVMKNRADSMAYGNQNGGLMKAILSPKQFSMWNNDDPKLRALAAGVKAIPTSDANYQRAAAIADGVFGGTIPDTTNGATFYHTPDVHPAWSEGKTPVATIGGHYFYKLPLGASGAPGDLPAPAATSPAASPLAPLGPVGGPAAVGAVSRAVADARAFLGKNEVPDHDMIADYLRTGGQNLDPHQSAWCAAFVSASLQREGLPVPGKIVKDSQFVGGANARDYLTYGQGVTDPGQVQAGDILVSKDGTHVGFAEGPVRQGANGPEVQILAGNEKDTSGKYQPGSWTNPQTGQVASRSQVGDVAERWAPLSDFTVRRAPTGAPDAGPASSTAPAAAASAPIPAASATPASAAAPGSSGGNFAVPPGGAAPAPGSDKYSVIQGMTAGTGRNPMLYTAANFGNLFGGKAAPAAPPAAPAAAPAATPPASLPVAPPGSPLTPTPPDLSKDAPIGATGPTMPFLPNPFDNPAFPSTSAPPPPATTPAPITLPSLSAHWGADTPNDSGDLGHGRWLNGAPAATPDGPSMGFPAQTNPFGAPPPDQSSMNLPGSMLASAQNLIRLLFPPSQTG